jgi:hypothetical protein
MIRVGSLPIEMARDEGPEARRDAVACAAGVAVSVFLLFLCSAWLLRSASLPESLALTVMSVFGSAVIALWSADCHRRREEATPR